MSLEGREKVKLKLQELSALIAEEAAEESQEIKTEIVESINNLRGKLEKLSSPSDQKVEKTFLSDAKEDVEAIIDSTHIEQFMHDAKGDLDTIVKDLEYRALKTQYTIQEKFSNSRNKKDEVVIKSADSLVKAIDKVKCALVECEKKDA